MKTFQLSRLCFFLVFPAVAQEASRDRFDTTAFICREVISIMRANVLRRSIVNWESYNAKANHLLTTHASKEEVFQLLGSIFTDIGDYHGAFFYNGVRYGMKQPELKVRQELQDGFRIGAKVHSRVLDDTYGYIFIPPVNAFADDGGLSIGVEIDSIICNTSPRIKGWIIDLRLNLGGNMYPMIGGLQSLLGEGKVGAFVKENQDTVEWILWNGVFKAGTDSVRIAKNLCDYTSIPAVVLISQLTSSSGEAVAIAFKGRDNTIFIGEPTSGYISALNRYHPSDHTMLLVPESHMCDRNGVCYPENVKPDIISVQGDRFTDLEKDAKILQALSWLKQHK